MRTPANLILAGAAGAAAVVLLVAGAGIAHAQAQDPVTKGVSPAAANTACAGVVDKPVPSAANEAAARAAANTPTGVDDGPAQALVGAEWIALINQQEMHRDYLGLAGLDDSKTFTCDGAVADFPALALADDVDTAVCGNPRLDLIGSPALRNRVATALDELGRSYADARSDCPPPATTTPPTTTPAPTTTAPTTSPAPSTTPAAGGPLYATCAEASSAGAAPINVGEPGYMASLDSDDDGVACELPDSSALPVGGAATGG